jgi:hypothetical protein
VTVDGSEEVGSPAWWFEKLLHGFDARVPEQWRSPGMDPEPNWNETRRQRFERLWAYFTGRAPLPQVAAEYSEIFRAVMRKARSNWAPMPINALRNRMVLVGVSTKADNDTGGDDVAAEIARVSNLKVAVQDLLAYLFVMGESYGMVVPPKAGSSTKPMITALDPRNTIGDPSPDNPNVLRAALVCTADPLFGVERGSLFLPGKRFPVKRALSSFGGVNLGKWEWDGPPEDISGIDHLGGIPIVRLDNENGMGEFEAHIDLLDRINDTTLQRIVIAWYQSFRQRAVIGDLEGDTDDADATSEEIDWNEMFRADPGAFYRLPAGVTFWESGQADFTPIVNAKRDDVKEFGILTCTPLHMFAPDSANQTAEGASLTREGINFKVEDRRARVEPKLALLHEMAFAFAGDPKRGEGIRLQWGALETNSLGDKGSASAQAKGVLSLRNNLIEIWGMTPTQAEENITQLTAEQLLALATAQPQPAPQDANGLVAANPA